jgi:hypothetical protein
MNRIGTLILIACFMSSCFVRTASNCIVDKRFKEEFFAHIEFIDEAENKHPYYAEEYRESIIYLGRVTSHFPPMDPSNVGFSSKSEYQDSRQIWLAWYEDNKCNYTKQMADSVISAKQPKWLKPSE